MPKENIQVIQFDGNDGLDIRAAIIGYLHMRSLQCDIDLPKDIKYAYVLIDQRDNACDHIIITAFYREPNNLFNTMDTIYLFGDNEAPTESIIPTKCVVGWDATYDEPTSPCLIWEE